MSGNDDAALFISTDEDLSSSFFGPPQTLFDEAVRDFSDSPFEQDLYRSIDEEMEDLAPAHLSNTCVSPGFADHYGGHGTKSLHASFSSLGLGLGIGSKKLDLTLTEHLSPLRERSMQSKSCFQSEKPLQVNPETVAPFPVYHERYSSFISRASLENIISVITSQLNLIDRVDFTYNAPEHSIRGVSYHENASTFWKFKVYQGPEKGTFLCEFQRRSGCGIGFRHFYQKITQACAVLQAPITTPPVKRTANLSGHIKSIPSGEASSSIPDLSPLLCESLSEWISAHAIDVKVEGFRFIASLTGHTEYQQQLVESTNLLKCLSGTLSSNDIEIQRLSFRILADLSRNPLLQRGIVGTFLDPICGILEQPSSYLKLDTQRSAIGCLLSLVSNEAIRKSIMLVSPLGYSRCRRTLLSMSEPRLLQLCERTLLAMK